MALLLQPHASLLGPLEKCGTEGVVREFNNSLITAGEEFSELTVSEYEFTQLSFDPQEVRLLRLHPTDDLASHVRCNLEIHTVANMPSFIAIQNARGYRKIQEVIELDGRALFISVSLERFLRYLRTKIGKPILVWVRYACVFENNLEEQKTYWTRQFSDKMYALASEVVDMHETNSRLIENGYFEKVFDSRYRSWDKQWSGISDQMILPRVCPVRLGTLHDTGESPRDYQYMPLDRMTDEIRVLNIMPAENPSAPIIIHAAHCPIKCEAFYIALSYRWGTDETPELITMNQQRKAIRKNLAEAIRAIRMTDKVVPLWIDAISIDQDNIIERGIEVKRMGRIYDCAMSVYSYVGLPDEQTEEVLEFMIELNKHPMIRWNNEGEFHFGDWEGENTIKPERLARLCVGLYRFLTRRYFRRSWILQEVAWASNPTIFAGRRLGTTFETLDRTTYHLLDMLLRDPSLAGQMQAADPSLEKVNIDMLAYPRKLFYFRYLMSNGRGGGAMFPFYNIETTSPGFLEVLILTRDFEATDPRDHILSVWNLARDKDDLIFKPDYHMSCDQVYAEFAKAWIRQHGVLDILGAVEFTQNTSGFYERVASWCPDWDNPATASCLVRKERLPTRPMSAVKDQSGKLYSADGSLYQGTITNPTYIFVGEQLHCTGVVLDSIDIMFDDAPDIPAGTALKSKWRAQFWTEQIGRFYKGHDLGIYDDASRAAWAMFHGDSITAWPPIVEGGYGPDASRSNERYVCLPEHSRHVLPYAGSYSRTEAWGVVDSVLRGRTPFMTKNGYMGLAPNYVDLPNCVERKLLLIAVVHGCSVPLLLHERDDGTYRLVGTCFVQGWMNGEWIESMMGAENSDEFWSAAKDSAEIIIS